MSVLTYEQISKLNSTRVFKESTALYKSLTVKNSVKKKDMFLSHSSLDNPRLSGVIKFFEKFDASVYVDNGDKRLPKIPSTETASILRSRIKSLKRFVVLLSPASYKSTWIPWELGLAHGYKGRARTALLPTSNLSNGAKWVKRHYFGLYPRIIFGKLEGHFGKVWQVYDPKDNLSWLLETWLYEEP